MGKMSGHHGRHFASHLSSRVSKPLQRQTSFFSSEDDKGQRVVSMMIERGTFSQMNCGQRCNFESKAIAMNIKRIGTLTKAFTIVVVVVVVVVNPCLDKPTIHQANYES